MRIVGIQSVTVQKASFQNKKNENFKGTINISHSVSESVSPLLLDKIEATLANFRLDAIESKYSVVVDLVDKSKGQRVLRVKFLNDKDAVGIASMDKRKAVCAEIDLPDDTQMFQTIKRSLVEKQQNTFLHIVPSNPEGVQLGFIHSQQLTEDVFEQTLNSEIFKYFKTFVDPEHSITYH